MSCGPSRKGPANAYALVLSDIRAVTISDKADRPFWSSRLERFVLSRFVALTRVPRGRKRLTQPSLFEKRKDGPISLSQLVFVVDP